MATTVLGDDSVPKTKFQALAGELRLLKSGMADMQGRLDALLIEIGTELEQACKAASRLPRFCRTGRMSRTR